MKFPLFLFLAGTTFVSNTLRSQSVRTINYTGLRNLHSNAQGDLHSYVQIDLGAAFKTNSGLSARTYINNSSEADSTVYSESTLFNEITNANQKNSTGELVSLIYKSKVCCSRSAAISGALTKWLREDHAIYKGKSATETDLFRGYLLYSLAHFPPNEEMYRYIKFEFLFSGHVYNLAAAASTAKNFPEKSEEIIELMRPYLKNSYLDEWVDITTTDLKYPLLHPTKARYEMIRTLTSFGASAYPSVEWLDELSASPGFNIFLKDSLLAVMSAEAASYIKRVTPPCCRKDAETKMTGQCIQLIEKKNRKKIKADDMILIDQDANRVKIASFGGRPFVLTYFYTQCANPLKCASTVNRLADLQTAFADEHRTNQIGIYGITYDPDSDSPDMLKRFGNMYGITFTKNVKFLQAVDKSDETFSAALQLRVNYGNGTVNQHGIQLFIFDKRGRLAAVSDNEKWSVADLKKCLNSLVAEE